MSRFLALAALALVGCAATGAALAATVTVTWTAPTLNTDGSTIPATGEGSLTTYRIEYGTCTAGAFGTKQGEVSRPAPMSTTTLNLNPGMTCVRVFVANTYGAESDPSNVASTVVAPPKPRAPTNVTAL